VRRFVVCASLYQFVRPTVFRDAPTQSLMIG